jgi:transcriptional regulator with XRE-family HTH domain
MKKPAQEDIKDLVARAGLSQVRAAKELGIDPRTMRRYCLGESPPPRSVVLALRWLNHTKNSPSE